MTESSESTTVNADSRGRITLGSWAKDAMISVVENDDGTVTLKPVARAANGITEKERELLADRKAQAVYVSSHTNMQMPTADMVEIVVKIDAGKMAGLSDSSLKLRSISRMFGDLPVVIAATSRLGVVSDMMQGSSDGPEVYRVSPVPSWASFEEWNTQEDCLDDYH